jgi:hypothetical protein
MDLEMSRSCSTLMECGMFLEELSKKEPFSRVHPYRETLGKLLDPWEETPHSLAKLPTEALFPKEPNLSRASANCSYTGF